MNSLLVVGIIVLAGFIMGELAGKVRLPKVTGYIVAGILLNPGICHFIPANFPGSAVPVANIALAFIAFFIGGTLYYARIKQLGKSILSITFFEAEITFLVITAGFLFIAPFVIAAGKTPWLTVYIPISVLIGSLGAPTDPSIAIAVKSEYNVHGKVSDTILGVSALDDVLGIINFSIAIILAETMVMHKHFSLSTSLLSPFLVVSGSIALGVVFGFIFNFITSFLKKHTEGVFIVIIFGFLSLCFGLSSFLKLDELLAIMTMGIVVVNFNPKREVIFKVLERYIEKLIFVLFFTLSGMQLNLSVMRTALVFIAFFIILRVVGKYFGTMLGAHIAGSPAKIKKYTAWGLIPQGGVVVGLALMIKQNPVFYSMADIIIGVVVGATVINEFLGPIFTKIVLKKAGEIT